MLQFKKYEGLGNDFIIPTTIHMDAECLSSPLTNLNPVDCLRWAKLCDRRLSIGADGVLLHYEAQDGGHFMAIINQDGSVAEMCGNGLRCMALHLHHQSNQTVDSFHINTLAGMMHTKILPGSVQCHVGPVSVSAFERLTVAGTTFGGYSVNTGNPHFVIFDEVSEIIQTKHASALSQHPTFEQGANISFAQAAGDEIQLRVFERGCGWTRACGTAAIATTAAHWSKFDCEGHGTRVHLPGGTLDISGAYEGMIMNGPASLTFTGQIGE